VRVRTVILTTGILSAVIGGIVVYLVLTVPNDVQAASLMRQAKQQMAAGEDDHARNTLSRIVQQYPRTDAAAAATVALVTLADNERQKLIAELEQVRRDQATLQKQLASQNERVQTIENRPPPAPVIIHEAPPPKAPAKTLTPPATAMRHPMPQGWTRSGTAGVCSRCPR